jgi:hypothetical protein
MGRKIRFWEDTWFDTAPLAMSFGSYIVFVMKRLRP